MCVPFCSDEANLNCREPERRGQNGFDGDAQTKRERALRRWVCQKVIFYFWFFNLLGFRVLISLGVRVQIGDCVQVDKTEACREEASQRWVLLGYWVEEAFDTCGHLWRLWAPPPPQQHQCQHCHVFVFLIRCKFFRAFAAAASYSVTHLRAMTSSLSQHAQIIAILASQSHRSLHAWDRNCKFSPEIDQSQYWDQQIQWPISFFFIFGPTYLLVFG